jgi:hypothetical protein
MDGLSIARIETSFLVRNELGTLMNAAYADGNKKLNANSFMKKFVNWAFSHHSQGNY